MSLVLTGNACDFFHFFQAEVYYVNSNSKIMVTSLRSSNKKSSVDDSVAIISKRKMSGSDASLDIAQVQAKTSDATPVEEAPAVPKLTVADYIYTALGGDTVGNLISLSDIRDELVKESSAGFFPDVITGCIDVSMAVMEAMFKLADSIDAFSLTNEDVMREKVRVFILSILDAVYGPNSVRIIIYNPDVDWNISLWQMFPVPDSPSARSFLSQVPSQSDTLIQWLDLKSQLVKQCRNPKREAQRVHKISALEEELQELALRHAGLIDRFIKIQQGEKDPEAAQAKREAMAKRLEARKYRLGKIVHDKHQIPPDPITRTKRDAILWGGPPHVGTNASLNNSTLSAKAGSSLVRRLSRFGFREDDFSEDAASTPEDYNIHHEPAAKANVGCLGIFGKCCIVAKK